METVDFHNHSLEDEWLCEECRIDEGFRIWKSGEKAMMKDFTKTAFFVAGSLIVLLSIFIAVIVDL